MENKEIHNWVMDTCNGLQFKDCFDCNHTNTLEYHFDVIDGDIVECENCGSDHKIFALY